MNIVAFDLSLTSTGWARTLTDYGTIQTGNLRGPARLAHILTEARQHAHGADIVCIENYAYARANQAHQIGELGGVIRLWLWRSGVPWVVVPPKTLKKYATSRGNASKREVLQAAWSRLGYDGTDDNEADALWLAQMVGDAYELDWTVRVPKVQRDVLGKVDWPALQP